MIKVNRFKNQMSSTVLFVGRWSFRMRSWSFFQWSFFCSHYQYNNLIETTSSGSVSTENISCLDVSLSDDLDLEVLLVSNQATCTIKNDRQK